MSTRVLIAGGGTGGHLMPALALASALRGAANHIEPVLVGAARGVEGRLLPERDFRYHLLPVEPIYRRAWWRNLRWPFLWWRVRRACRRVLDEERPALVLGTGGYAAGPVLLAAARRGIPIALQEQNAYPGITTRWLARRARQIHLGFPEAQRYLRLPPSVQVFTYGNPIQPPPEPRPTPAAARERVGVSPTARVLFVMGGSQGARRINDVVADAIADGGLDALTLLWSTGPAMFHEFASFHDPPRRIVRAFWDPIADAYAAADLVVARSGAMTTAELCAWALPAVLVPLPTSAAHHQTRNAEALAGAGAAVHLPEAALTPAALVARVRELLDAPPRLERMRRAAGARGRPEAARRITEALMALMG
jgi:UDP-N-acetylglucosamine--N-acetylmuramyl-(pentapeptide) pyrophosphoryl-undecaprenol N-acetylglucosamine transferase